MRRGYGQYCPLALSAELLCKRWTILVISRVVDGCQRFNDIHRGVPRMSPTLLTQRLRELEEAGVIASRPRPKGPGREYRATPAGRELAPLIDDLAVWGQKWAREMETDDLDPTFLVWSMHTRMNVEEMPSGRTVLEFSFTGAPRDCRQFWLVHEGAETEMCLEDPELDVDVAVRANLRRFVEAWRGFRDLRTEIAEGKIKVYGEPDLVDAFPDWLLLSALSPHPRMRQGREQRLGAPASPRQG